MTKVKKWTFERHGKKYFFLGADANGKNHFLESAHFDCGWYWGLGYIETFTNNRRPAEARDIDSHTHFDYLFFDGAKGCAFDVFKNYFPVTPLTDNEIWQLLELMKALYLARNYSDMIYRGGAHYTTNPAADVIRNDAEYKRINETVIPAMNKAVYRLLGGDDYEN